MASGTISLGQNDALIGQIVWSSVVDTANNRSRITATLQAKKAANTTVPTSGTWSYSLTIGSTTVSGTPSISIGQSWVTLRKLENVYISHNTDGSGSAKISGKVTGPASTSLAGVSVSASQTVTLDKIARYATVSVSVTSKTETAINIKWSSNAKLSTIRFRYKKTSASSWTSATVTVNATSGSRSFSGLSVGTGYNIELLCTRADNSLQTTVTLSENTYWWPYATSMPSFTIGNPVKLQFYNPLGRTFTFDVIVNNTAITDSNWTVRGGTTYTGLDGASTVSALYTLMANQKSTTYAIRCNYATGDPITKTGGTVSVNASVNAPTINSFTAAAHTADNPSGVTGIVQNLTRVDYAVSVTPKNSASLASASVAVGGKTYAMTVSSNTASVLGGVITSGSQVAATVTVTDSRGLTKTASVNITPIPYNQPSATIELARQYNFYTETDIRVNATVSAIEGMTNTAHIQYRIKQTTASTWGSWTNLTNNTTTTFNADQSYAWDVNIRVYDDIGGVDNAVEYSLILPKGVPLIFFDRLRNSVSINGIPAHDEDISINGKSLLPQVLYDNSNGSNDTISSLSASTANFEYIEIFFTDNNKRDYGSIKVYQPNGKKVALSMVEASNASVTTIRRTRYDISGTSLIPDTTYAAYVRIENGTLATNGKGTNYLYITRVIGWE